MIKSKFSKVKRVDIDNGEIVVFDANPDDLFYVYFSGTIVESIEGISPDEIYSQLLINWDKEIKALYFIMKTNRIYQISPKDTKVIDFLVKNGKTFIDVDDIDAILEFINL
jgi:hypothetical protein